ncbi:hypothetical protein [Rhodococcus ruber]|uniref:hypothetical protein n=1 Tax=Rhodococcus ruber TaxID=1830 RepID=UPI0037833498
MADHEAATADALMAALQDRLPAGLAGVVRISLDGGEFEHAIRDMLKAAAEFSLPIPDQVRAMVVEEYLTGDYVAEYEGWVSEQLARIPRRTAA